MPAFNAWQSPNVPAHKWGGGGGPPQGEFNGIGAKLAHFGRRKFLRQAFFYPLTLNVLKNGVLEGPGLDFGSPGPRFWRV